MRLKVLGRRPLGLLLIVVTVTLLGSSAPAAATVPHDGWGMGIADDDAIGSPVSPPSSVDNNFFDRLRPKVYRFQIYWDAGEVGNEVYVSKALTQIARARAAGVQTVLATFKQHGSTPTAASYEAKIRNVVDKLKNEVDVWGPANEPNDGENWLPGMAGARLLAEYNAALARVVSQVDPTATRTSPDFVQPTTLQSLIDYVNEYINHGGGWGHYIAFHPYRGVAAKNLSGVTTLAGMSPNSKPIWVTEVGARWFGDPSAQNSLVHWMIYGEPTKPALANHERVAKIFYYHMKSGHTSHDSALLYGDLQPRAAWYTWCKAAHGDNAGHPDCAAPPSVPAASFNSSYASYRGNGVVDIFARGTNGALWHKYYHPATAWTNWASLGGQLASEPSVVTYGGGEIDVFARGTGSQLLVRQYRPATGWGDWIEMWGWGIASAPSAIHRGGGIVDVFARGGDNALIHRSWIPGSGWTDWGWLGGQLASEPSAVAYGGGEIDVFARGTGSQLLVRQYRPATGWGDWIEMWGWGIASGPSVMNRGGGVIDVFARGGDNALIHRSWIPGSGWTEWGWLGGQLTGSPAAMSYGNGAIDVYSRDTTNQLTVRQHRQTTGWLSWNGLGAMP
jgi:hypothetical protein